MKHSFNIKNRSWSKCIEILQYNKTGKISDPHISKIHLDLIISSGFKVLYF